MSNNDINSLQRTDANLNQKLGTAKDPKAIDPVDIAIQQLQLKVTDAQDKKQIKKILQILQYPSTQVADIHVAANRLGNRDQQVPQLAHMNKSGAGNNRKQQLSKSAVYCPCCSMVKQQYQLKLCQPLDDISNLGMF